MALTAKFFENVEKMTDETLLTVYTSQVEITNRATEFDEEAFEIKFHLKYELIRRLSKRG